MLQIGNYHGSYRKKSVSVFVNQPSYKVLFYDRFINEIKNVCYTSKQKSLNLMELELFVRLSTSQNYGSIILRPVYVNRPVRGGISARYSTEVYYR